MRTNLAALIGIVLLVNCANTPNNTETSLPYRQQLEIYKNMKIRLYRVAAPLKKTASNMCDRFTVDSGNVYHRVSDYPKSMRAVAQNYWGLTDELQTLFYQKKNSALNCYAPLTLHYGKEPNAFTDGENIFATPSLLDAVDDLSLALIIAHELAHISRGHINMEPSETLEREADRFAMFMLARTNLNYRKASTQDAAHKKPQAQGSRYYTDTGKRAEHFRKIVLEIETLKANGQELIP